MEQSRPKEPKNNAPKAESNFTSEGTAAGLFETKPSSTKGPRIDMVDLTRSDCEDSTYIDSSEKKSQLLCSDTKMKMTAKRKAAPLNFNNEEDPSEPESKPSPKKRKPNPKNPATQTRKKTNATTGDKSKAKNKPKAKPKAKSKNQLTIEGREARKECKNLKSEIEDLNRSLGDLRKEHFNLLRRGNAAFMDDDLVKDKLFDLRESCKAWTWKYSTHSELPDLDASTMQALVSLLASLKCPISNEANVLIVGRLKYGSRIILNALLMQFICSQFIQQPFFFLHGNLNERPTEEIKCFFDNLSTFSLDYANDWVSHTLEMLIPSRPEYANRSGNGIWDGIHESKIDCYSEAAKEFINGVATVLLSPQNKHNVDERLTDLSHVLKEAGELSIRLRKQRVGIRCLYIDSPKLTGKGFQPNSGLMEPHESIYPKEGIHTLAGKEIIMVMDPAIVAYRTNGGETVEKEKVWAKSVVWVDGGDEVEAGNELGNEIQEQKTMIIDNAQPVLEQPSATPIIMTPGTNNDGGQGPKDVTTTWVETNKVQPPSNDNDNPFSNASKTTPDPMEIVEEGDEGKLPMHDTKDNGIGGPQPLLSLNPEASQGSTTEQANAIFGTKCVSKPLVENHETFPQSLVHEPHGPIESIDNPEPATSEENENLLLEHKEEVLSSNNIPQQVSVVINMVNPVRDQDTPFLPPSEVQADTGAGDATRGGLLVKTEDTECPFNQICLSEPEAERIGQNAQRNEGSEVLSESAKIESVSAVGGQQGGGVGKQPIAPGIGEELPIKAEIVDDVTKGLPLDLGNTEKQEVPATLAALNNADQKFKEKEAEAVSSLRANTPGFMDDKACTIL